MSRALWSASPRDATMHASDINAQPVAQAVSAWGQASYGPAQNDACRSAAPCAMGLGDYAGQGACDRAARASPGSFLRMNSRLRPLPRFAVVHATRITDPGHHVMTPDHTPATPDHDTIATAPDSPERRAALQKLAVLSAWTVPTTLMLLRSKRASAESPQPFNELPPDEPGTEGPPP